MTSIGAALPSADTTTGAPSLDAPVFRGPTVQDLLAVRPQIESALVYANGCYTFDDIVGMVLSGRVQFWWRGQSIILTEVVNHPRKRVLVPLLAAGNQEDLKVMAAGVEMWAVAQGCSEVWLTGRKGWLRSFLKDDGWEQDDKITLHRALGRAR